MKRFKNLFIVLLTFGLLSWVFANVDSNTDPNQKKRQPKNNDIWVAVCVFDGIKNTASEYSGRMDESTFHKITDNQLEKGFFRLDSVFWIDPTTGKTTSMEQQQVAGVSRGYTSTVYFKIEHVTRIVPINSEFAEKSSIKN